MAALPIIQSATSLAIDEAWAVSEERRDDTVLRCSGIGEECDARLWHAFHWTHHPEAFAGRMLRLFETGNIEEDRLVADLKMIGCVVTPVDPATGEQFEVSFLDGHCTGHTDGELTNLPEAPKTAHLLECKTHNDRSWKAVVKDGVEKAKPKHYAQMQIYMHGRGLKRALYVAKNKNDDHIYTERVEYDVSYAIQLLARAERIIKSAGPPPRMVEDPTSKMAWACGYCPAKGVCHDGVWPRRNCRTCLHSTAESGGDARWTCDRFHKDLTRDEQQAGCPHHLYIPALVPGTQIDADEAGERVTYQLPDGSTWTDGVAP